MQTTRQRCAIVGACALVASLVCIFVATRHHHARAWRYGDLLPLSADTDRLLQKLIRVPPGEVGQVAICASVRSKGRFLTEWLLYHRAVGVDRFYLYDSGSLDDTLVMLQPWIEAGTVVLHAFRYDQGGHYQTSALETCSRTYGPRTEWLLEADIDEFHVPTPALKRVAAATVSSLRNMPEQPLRGMLTHSSYYADADAVVSSRVTFKNAGIKRLADGASVLRSQTLREFQHSISYDKSAFTKSLLHTRKQARGWIMPGAHFLKHESRNVSHSKIITPDGHAVVLEANDPALQEGYGTISRFTSVRAACSVSLYRARSRRLPTEAEGRPKAAQGWMAGSGGYDVYQDSDEWVPLHEKDSFYGGAVRDLLMSTSWYGQHLPALVRAGRALARRKAAQVPLRQAIKFDPHPALVDFLRSEGLSPINGMPLNA